MGSEPNAHMTKWHTFTERGLEGSEEPSVPNIYIVQYVLVSPNSCMSKRFVVVFGFCCCCFFLSEAAVCLTNFTTDLSKTLSRACCLLLTFK